MKRRNFLKALSAPAVLPVATILPIQEIEADDISWEPMSGNVELELIGYSEDGRVMHREPFTAVIANNDEGGVDILARSVALQNATGQLSRVEIQNPYYPKPIHTYRFPKPIIMDAATTITFNFENGLIARIIA